MLDGTSLAPARASLLHHFGYEDFRPLQTRVVRALEQGSDVLAVLPTGAGKSICFQVPAMLRREPTIVISPLISLMQDQVAAATARGIPAAAMNSTLSSRAQRDLMQQVARGEVRLLYTSPERLGRLTNDLAARGVRPGLLAVDEAHCISEWGTDFRPAYRTLRRLRARLGWPQVIALTGSATPAVRRDISRALGLGRGRGVQLVLGSFDRRNLWFGVACVRDERERLRALIASLRLQDELAIVYAPTRNLVEELARVLGNAGFRAAPYHAGLSAAARREVLSRFLTNELGVVVATCAFGMGIDKPNVRLVVHWILPPTPEAYYQEAGRAGRDGGLARCILLSRPGDSVLPRRQLDITFPPERLAEQVWSGHADPARLPANLRTSLERLHRELRPAPGRVDWEPIRQRRQQAEERIAVMERYAQARRCRRAELIGYFGERIARCSGCDVCSGAPSRALSRPDAERRLTRLRAALGHLGAPWGGCPLEPETLRRLAHQPPANAAELAAVEGVGRVLAGQFGRTILKALAEGGADRRRDRVSHPAPVSVAAG